MTRHRTSKPRRSSARVVLAVLVAVVILFTALSVVSFLLGFTRPETNHGGILGQIIARALVAALGWLSIAVPVMTAVAAVLGLRSKRSWRGFASFCLLLLAAFAVGSILSLQLGAGTAQTNFGGWTGVLVATQLCAGLGFAAYLVPALAALWSLGLWLRTPARRSLLHTLFLVLIALFFDLFLALSAKTATWHPPDSEVWFPIAGSFGVAAIDWLRNLLGPVGAVVALVAGVVIALALCVTIPTHLLQRAQIWLKQLFTRKPRVQVKPARPAVAPPEPQPQTRSAPASGPEPAAPAGVESREPEPAPARKSVPAERPRATRPGPAFDLDRFQREFLDRLDVAGPEDQVFKDPREAEKEAGQLLDKLRQFDIDGRVSDIQSGPMITRFELEPAPGIKIQRIENLADDLSLALSAERVRILAPIPGKSAVGIEIPNRDRCTVHLRDLLVSEAFRNEARPLGFALGTTITGEPCCADLRTMPHILIAGTTGSGKSVCINSIICSIIFRASHREVRFLTVDPKQLELPMYNPIPHLLESTTTDPKRAVKGLDEIVRIMDVRYGEFANLGVRDIASYNARAEAEGLEPKPYIVVVIDELADLMLRAANEIEERITRLAQMSRAVGIHLILATQRPSVDVITGLIKANFPCRIAFQVASKTDSRTILDMNGAESLLGRGDMLFLPPGKGEPIRLHGAFVSEQATKRIVDLWTTTYLESLLTGRIPDPADKAAAIVAGDVVDVLYDREKSGIKRKRQALCEILTDEVAEELMNMDYYEPLPEVRSGAVAEHVTRQKQEARTLDEKFVEAAQLVVRHREASVSMLQRRLDVGWARAGRIIDQLEEAGIVGPYVGSKSRKVTVENEAELARLLAEAHNSAEHPDTEDA